MRKFISILSAAALVSSVVVVPITAGAEDGTVLWSDTFDTYTNSVTHQASPEGVGNVLVDGTSTAKSAYSGIGGVTLYTTDRADDSSYFQVNPVEEGSTDLYLQTQVSRFSNASRGAAISFTDTYTAEEGKDIVLASKIIVHNEGGTTYDNAFRVGKTVIDMDDIGASADVWHDIKIVVSSSGTAVYLDNDTTTAVATGSDVSLNEIKFVGTVDGVDDTSSSGAQKSTLNHPFGYPTFGFNDMVIYTAADGVTAPVPSAEDREEATAAPTPTPVPEIDAPVLSFPADVTAGDSFTFDDNETAKWSETKDVAQTVKDIAGMSIAIGSRENDTQTFAEVEEYGSGKVFSLGGGRWSTVGRGPVVSFDNNLDISADTTKTTVMAFAVRLSAQTETGVGRLYILKDATLSGEKADGAYRNVMAVLTTDKTGASITRGDNGTDVIGIDVDADKWYVVTVMVSDGRYRVFVDGEQKVTQDNVATGEGASTVTALPMLAVASGNSSSTPPYSLTRIDNILTYQGVLGEKASELLPVTDGEVIATEDPIEATASPEPASTVEGSGIDLAANARETIAPFAAVEGTPETVLNHSQAKPAAAGEVNALSDNARGNAIYASYDVLVNAGDKLTLAAQNGSSLGAQFIITGNEDGTATASYIPDSKGEVFVDGNLVCGTWYRVVIEIPQNREVSEETGEGYTVTGEATYTIYRINAADPTKTAGIAAQAAGIGARNLYDRGIKTLQTTVEGTPYIDNGVTYLNKSSANTWYRYFFTVGENGVKTVTSIETIDDPTSTSGKLGTEYYIWNALMQPYVPAADETPEPPAE